MPRKDLITGQSNAGRLGGAPSYIAALQPSFGTVEVVNLAVGGTGLLEEAHALLVPEIQYWLDESPGTPYSNMRAGAAGHTFDSVLWIQGEAEGHRPFNGTYLAYYRGLSTLWSRMKRDLSFTTPNPRFYAMAIGRSTYASGSDQSFSDVRRAIRDWCDITPDATYAGHAIDVPMQDYVHWLDYTRAGQQFAQAVLHDAGLASYSLGPSIFDWQQIGDIVNVTLMHDGGTDFTPTTGITGFTAEDASGNALVVVSAVRENATTIQLTMADATTITKLHYLRQKYPDVSGAVKDNSPLMLPMEFYVEAPIYADLQSTYVPVPNEYYDLQAQLSGTPPVSVGGSVETSAEVKGAVKPVNIYATSVISDIGTSKLSAIGDIPSSGIIATCTIEM